LRVYNLTYSDRSLTIRNYETLKLKSEEPIIEHTIFESSSITNYHHPKRDIYRLNVQASWPSSVLQLGIIN